MKTPGPRRIAFVLEATPRKTHFPEGWVWTFPTSASGAKRARGESGWTSIRIDRATRDRLEALRAKLPDYLSELQGDLLDSRDLVDSRRREYEMSVVELVAALSIADVKLMDAPAAPAAARKRKRRST